MNPPTWQNLEQLFVAQDIIKVKIYSVAELRYYRKESFIFVINTGMNEEISLNLSFNEIRQFLIQWYNAA